MPRMNTCWYCGSDVPFGAQYCHVCGHSQSDRTSSPLMGVVDPMTGIWNQKFVEALIGQEANRAIRYHRPLSVLVVELDHAEHIHNELSQTQVSTLMSELADTLGRAIRDTDTLGFLEADRSPHFVIILPETDQHGATLAADKIRRAIAAHDFSAGGGWQRITVSCGAATIGISTEEFEAGLMSRREYTGNLLREAYSALEHGRSAGTNRTSVGAYRN